MHDYSQPGVDAMSCGTSRLLERYLLLGWLLGMSGLGLYTEFVNGLDSMKDLSGIANATWAAILLVFGVAGAVSFGFNYPRSGALALWILALATLIHALALLVTSGVTPVFIRLVLAGVMLAIYALHISRPSIEAQMVAAVDNARF